MSPVGGARWLLVGNSRWHWAERTEEGALRGWDGAPADSAEEGPPPLAWAAVGRRPDPSWASLDRQVALADVPLAGCPPWLGVDRALAGWEAWREKEEAVLVADAGTVLSLTRVDGAGRFRGGRLSGGLGLQLEAMANRTALLPRPPAPGRREAALGSWGAGSGGEEDPAWPVATAGAMRLGVEKALAATVLEAAQSAGVKRLVLTGGDGPWLWRRVAEPLKRLGFTVSHRPLLCLESLASLRPDPGR